MPVRPSAFAAAAAGPAARLAWATASELHSAYFAVERSPDGRQWQELARVPAAGRSSAPRAYAHHDATRPAGLSYYRLRLVDADGTFSYSSVRVVRLGGAAAPTLAVYPNPARGVVQVARLPAGALVQVFDALGRAVTTATTDASGAARLVLPVGLAAGVYVVRGGGQAVRLAVE